jgi:hypothetical protein
VAHHDRGTIKCRAVSTLGCLAVAIGSLSCGGASDAAVAWDGAVRDSAGVEIVENSGTPLWREGEDWTFTEVVRVGTPEGEPEYEFGRIGGMVVLSDRRIVVADQLAQHLRFFSPDGVYERTVGRRGQGPGEFGGAALIPRLGPGDTVLVFDRANQRVHVIAPDGTWVESFSTLPQGGYRLGLFLDAMPPGRLMTYDFPLRQSDGTPTHTTDILLELDLHGTVLDTMARLPTWLVDLAPGESAPFYTEAVDVALCEGGLAIGHNYQYRSVWYGAGGVVRRIVSLPSERPPLTDEDRSVMIGRYDQLMRANNVPAARAAQVRANIHFTETYPHYTQFVCGPAGTLLVQRVRPLSALREEERSRLRTDLQRPPGGLEWDAFDREGRYLGVAQLPGTEWVAIVPKPRFVQDRATGSWYMYAIWADEQDVQYVVGWRMDGL